MNQEQTNPNYLYEPEFSIKKVLADRKADLIYLTGFKKYFAVAVVAGTILGALVAWIWPVSYTAKTTFIIEDSKATGGSLLAGLAGQFGLDMAGALGGATGVLAGDNVMALLKSQYMIERAILTPYDDSTSAITLADKYAESQKLKKTWKKYTKTEDPIMFPADRKGYTRLQDSLFQDILIKISEKHLSVAKPDKKLGFFELNMTTRDEKLSQLFSARIIDEATEFYINTKTRTQRVNVARLESRADSIQRLLNRKTYTTSASNQVMLDNNPAFPTTSVNIELNQRDKMVLQTIYGEIIKNLELSKMMLIQETPTFQIVDRPHTPLKKNQIKYPKGIVLGIFFSVIACAIILISKKPAQN